MSDPTYPQDRPADPGPWGQPGPQGHPQQQGFPHQQGHAQQPGYPTGGYPQQGYPTQGYPQQGYPQGQPTSASAPSAALKFTVQGNVMTTNMIPPTLTIDGYPAPTVLGSTMIPIQPGQHRLAAWSQWMRKYGQAELDVTIEPNTTLEVFYAAPIHQFTTGSMGLTKQKRKGVATFVTIMAVLFGIIILAVVLGNLS